MSRVLDLWAGMTGTVLPFAGSDAPEGWLLCYGQAVSRATYPNLFAKIGTTYGTGDGSTTFNLPDCRGRVAAGKDNMGGAAANRLTTGGSGINGANLGATGGAETHTLTVAQMPSHTHEAAATNGFWTDIGGRYVANAGGATINMNNFPSTDPKGGSQPHPNVQPAIVMNSIIKT